VRLSAGVYLKGSFALGLGRHPTPTSISSSRHHQSLDGPQERAVRELHRVLPDQEEHWAHNLEGSYASLHDLRQRAEPGYGLAVRRQRQPKTWSGLRNDNTEVFRWVLHNRALR